MWLQLREEDVPLFFGTCVLLLLLAYLLLERWLTTCKKMREVTTWGVAEAEDALRAEIMEYLIPPIISSMNVCAVRPDAEDASRAKITEYLRPPTSSKSACAVCKRPTTFRCKACKAVRYCSFTCQMRHWRKGHRYECMKWHDSGASSYGGPATKASQHMPFLTNQNPPLGDSGIHLHDMNSNTLSELSFPTTDSNNLDDDPVPIERSNMNKSNQSLHMSQQDAVIGVPCEKNNYSVHEVTRPPEIMLVNKVSDRDFRYSDAMSGKWDITYPVNPQQPSICAPDIRKRQNASITVCKHDMGVNLTSGMVSSCEGIYVSSTEPLLRSSSSGNTIEHEALEQLLIGTSAKPMMLSYAVLKDITNNFSEVIGGGGSGEVYMGVLENGKVAVKKLYNTEAFTEKQFEDELTCLIRVEHKNIVRLLGYCSDTQQKVVEYNGRLVLADIRRRFLCFEYAPNKSLDDYLKGDILHQNYWKEGKYQ